MADINATDGAVLEALNDKADRDLQNTLGGGTRLRCGSTDL